MKNSDLFKETIKYFYLVFMAVMVSVICMKICNIEERYPVPISKDSKSSEAAQANKSFDTTCDIRISEGEDGKLNIGDEIDKRNRFIKSTPRYKSDNRIEINTDECSYQFVDMQLVCSKFVVDNDMWYGQNISPYISPGAGHDLYVHCDQNDNHYIKMHVINTTNGDRSATDCTVFQFGVQGVEGVSVCGICIGDTIEDTIDRLGRPDSFSISDSDVISAATWDFGDYAVSVRGGTFRGDIEYVEAVCKRDSEFSNGIWR